MGGCFVRISRREKIQEGVSEGRPFSKDLVRGDCLVRIWWREIVTQGFREGILCSKERTGACLVRIYKQPPLTKSLLNSIPSLNP